MKSWIIITLVIVAFVAGYLLHKPKDKVVTNIVTRVEYRDRIVNRDTVIERKIYVTTNGTVITEEKEIIKDRIVEKEVIKEKDVIKEIPANKQWLVSLEYIHLNHEVDLQKICVGKHILGNLYVYVGIYNRADLFQEDYAIRMHWQQLSVGITYLF